MQYHFITRDMINVKPPDGTMTEPEMAWSHWMIYFDPPSVTLYDVCLPPYNKYSLSLLVQYILNLNKE
jgi:hypothetical protein